MKIILKNITKEFPNKKTGEVFKAVDDISIELPSDKLIGLLGPSGCGKSTTLYMIAGLHKPSNGEIYFGEKLVSNLPPEKRGIGLVFQNYALYPHMTVEQNIMFPLISRHENKKDAKIKAYEYAKLVGIEHLLDRKPNQLSGGQQQRVAIARALVKQPDVLLLDEPLSNLDARLRLQTREEIRRIQRQTGTTTLFVTHDQEEAMSISDLIVVMNHGVVHQIGRPQEVYNDPADLFVATFLGTPPINVIPAIKEKDQITFANGQILKDVTVKTKSKKLKIGIRPEFIDLDEKGEYTMVVDYVEYIGRDKIVVFKFEGTDETYKAVVQASDNINLSEGNKVRFNLNKFFIFEEDGKRLF